MEGICHILNRGVDKRAIVTDDRDRIRFIHDLFVFNDADPVPNYLQPGRQTEHARDLLVHIHAYCLMPNHYHLLLSPALENGISLFMQKLNMGYTKYFNERHKRNGALWQGKYKRIAVGRDAHMLYIPYYIHLNPLDMSHPKWREGAVGDVKSALQKLETYRWSSHLDYAGIRNFPSVIQRTLLDDMFGSTKKYLAEMIDIMTSSINTKTALLIES